MTSVITVDPHAAEPPFEQIRTAFEDRIADGRLVAGDRLPTVRALAGELGVAVNTVARAYRELEQRGLIETRGRGGSVVTGGGVDREARAAATAYAERVRALGLDADEALRLVSDALRR